MLQPSWGIRVHVLCQADKPTDFARLGKQRPAQDADSSDDGEGEGAKKRSVEEITTPGQDSSAHEPTWVDDPIMLLHVIPCFLWGSSILRGQEYVAFKKLGDSLLSRSSKVSDLTSSLQSYVDSEEVTLAGNDSKRIAKPLDKDYVPIPPPHLKQCV